MSYLKKYPLSIIIIGIILFLSFFNPPETPLNEVTNIDKVLHFIMYFGFCTVLWFEYFKSHERPQASRLIPWAIIAPILFSGLIEIGQQTLTLPVRPIGGTSSSTRSVVSLRLCLASSSHATW